MHDDQTIRRFAQELTAMQRRLYVYIVALVHQPADAEDVLQDVNRVLWEKVDEYTPGTNLAAWAFKTAYFEVLTWRKRKGREAARLGDATLELIAQQAAAAEGESERQAALRRCLEKLREADRRLIESRYLADADVQTLAAAGGRSEKSLYRSLARIRTALMECVERRLAAEGLA